MGQPLYVTWDKPALEAEVRLTTTEESPLPTNARQPTGWRLFQPYIISPWEERLSARGTGWWDGGSDPYTLGIVANREPITHIVMLGTRLEQNPNTAELALTVIAFEVPTAASSGKTDSLFSRAIKGARVKASLSSLLLSKFNFPTERTSNGS